MILYFEVSSLWMSCFYWFFSIYVYTGCLILYINPDTVETRIKEPRFSATLESRNRLMNRFLKTMASLILKPLYLHDNSI